MSKASQAQNASMDEILSSIRSIVKEEEQRPGSTPDADDDILELTDAVEEEEAPVATAQQVEQAPKEEFVDIKTFAETGQSVPADNAAVDAARQKYESETAPVTDEQKQAAPEAAELPSTDELVAEMANEALVDKAVAETADAETQASAGAPAAEEATAAPQEDVAEAPAPAAAPAVEAPAASAPSFAAGKPVSLKAIPGAQGLQVAFPVEVLAEALRPMIKDWVEANLSTIVEKLVREELSRLVDKS